MTQEKTGFAKIARNNHIFRRVKQIYLLGLGASALQVTLFLIAYTQTGAWQIVITAVLLLLCTAGMTLVNRFIIVDKNEKWVTRLIFAVMVLYSGQELFLSRVTSYVLVMNVLLIFLLGSLIFPQRWKLMIALTSGVILEIFFLNWFVPQYHYISANLPFLSHYVIPGNAIIIGAMATWPFFTLFHRIRVIRRQLLISFISVVLIPSIIISFISAVAELRQSQNHVISKLESVVTLKVAEIDAWANVLKNSLSFLAYEYRTPILKLLSQEDSVPKQVIGSHNELRKRFNRVLKNMRYFEEIFFMDAKGTVILSTDTSQEGKSWSDKHLFWQGLTKANVHPPFYSLSLGRMSVVSVSPVVNPMGKSIGVLAGRASMATLNEIMLERAGLGETGETYLVGANHVLLTKARFLEDEKEGRVYVRTEAVNTAVHFHRNGSGLHTDYRNESVVGVYRWLPDYQIALFAKQDQEEAFLPAYKTLAINGGVALIAVVIAIMAALLVTRSIANPLTELAKSAEKIESGNLTITTKVKREDEIGKLAKTFNNMTAQLRQFITKLEHQVLEFQEVNDIINKSPAIAFLWKNENGWPVEYVSENVKRLFGYTVKEFISGDVSYASVVHPDDLSRVADEISMYSRDEERKEFSHEPYRIIKKDGSIVWIDDMTFIRRDEYGNITHYQGIILDVNDRIMVERERETLEGRLTRSEKMESIGLMAGGIAHDLNNILSSIVNYPEILLMDLPEDSPIRKPIQLIQESGQRAADVVSDLLTVARGVATSKQTLSVNKLVEEYFNSIEHNELKSKYPDIHYRVHLDSRLLNIQGSASHLRKSLMNLLMNASEAIQGSGKIEVSTINCPFTLIQGADECVKEGDYALLSVSDDGVGIPAKDMERIFEPFYSKKVMGRSGTGLGLAVVWNTVKDHEGYINVESTENRTIFKLYFPATKEAVIGQSEILPFEAYAGKGETVLVVDDERNQRDIACLFLSKLGYLAESVPSGEKAIEFIREKDVDLIVLDMIMHNGMNGLETYREIKKNRPGQRAIIASGYVRTNDVKEAQKLGAGRYIKKPYTIESLGVAIKEALENNLDKQNCA